MQIQQKGLTNFQVSAIVTLSIIGLTIMFLPQQAAEYAGIDGTFSTFSAGILSIIMVGIIITLSLRFPNQTIIEYSQQILGKYLGKIHGAMIMLYSLVSFSYILRGFADAMKVLLLPKTPLEVTMICMLLISLYCVHGGISTIARTCEIFLFPILIVISFILIFNLPKVHLYRYRSSFSNGIMPIIRCSVEITSAYFGYEILYFLLPFMQNKKRAMVSGIKGMMFPILIYSLLVFIMIGIMGPKFTSELVYPTIHLAREIGIQLIECFDIFFIVFWILAVFSSLTSYLYMASISLTRLLGLRNYKPFISILAPICYTIAIFPQDVAEINFLSHIMNYGGMFIIFASIPLLILAVLRKKGGKKNAEKM